MCVTRALTPSLHAALITTGVGHLFWRLFRNARPNASSPSLQFFSLHYVLLHNVQNKYFDWTRGIPDIPVDCITALGLTLCICSPHGSSNHLIPLVLGSSLCSCSRPNTWRHNWQLQRDAGWGEVGLNFRWKSLIWILQLEHRWFRWKWTRNAVFIAALDLMVSFLQSGQKTCV